MPRARTSPRPTGGPRPLVTLEALTLQSPAALLAQVRALRLLPGQERFALAPVRALAPALVDPERTPFAVLAGEEGEPEVVGFGVLGRGGVLDRLVDDPARAVLLRGFVVDAGQQGLGVGTAAARQARTLAARVAPTADLLVLTCHDDNPAGLRAYARAGFVATGAVYRDAAEGVQQVLVATVARG